MTQLDIHLASKLSVVSLLAMDVDGVLTDGVLTYDDLGHEIKAFHVSDGLGIVLLLESGLTIAWISGRSSAVVARRAAELKVPYLLQGVRDKGRAIRDLSARLGVERNQVAYIADDWNDIPAFETAGVRIAVADAALEIREAADITTLHSGGRGAVREICEAILTARGQRATTLQRYLDHLTQPESDESVRQ